MEWKREKGNSRTNNVSGCAVWQRDLICLLSCRPKPNSRSECWRVWELLLLLLCSFVTNQGRVIKSRLFPSYFRPASEGKSKRARQGGNEQKSGEINSSRNNQRRKRKGKEKGTEKPFDKWTMQEVQSTEDTCYAGDYFDEIVANQLHLISLLHL